MFDEKPTQPEDGEQEPTSAESADFANQEDLPEDTIIPNTQATPEDSDKSKAIQASRENLEGLFDEQTEKATIKESPELEESPKEKIEADIESAATAVKETVDQIQALNDSITDLKDRLTRTRQDVRHYVIKEIKQKQKQLQILERSTGVELMRNLISMVKESGSYNPKEMVRFIKQAAKLEKQYHRTMDIRVFGLDYSTEYFDGDNDLVKGLNQYRRENVTRKQAKEDARYQKAMDAKEEKIRRAKESLDQYIEETQGVPGGVKFVSKHKDKSSTYQIMVKFV